MKRVVVAGAPGAGKSTFARKLASHCDFPYIELDALYHGPNWTKRPTFTADVNTFTRRPTWVTEWQFDEARPVILDRADTFVWLDLPFRLVLWRVTVRTLKRWILREELWAGNREAALWKIAWDRSNMIRWSVASRNEVPQTMPTIRCQAGVRIIRLKNRREVREFLTDCCAPHRLSISER